MFQAVVRKFREYKCMAYGHEWPTVWGEVDDAFDATAFLLLHESISCTRCGVYRTTPVQFNDAGLATRVEALVTVQATLRELPSDNILWSQSGLIFREQFDVPESGEFFDQESIALEGIALGVSSALVTSILEGF